MPGIDPPPTTDSHLCTCACSRSPPSVSASRCARRRTDSAGSRSMRATGTSSCSPVAMHREHLLERGDLHLVDAHRARDRVAAQLRDEVASRPRTHARLRPAEQLVAGERDEVGAVGERVGDRRLVGGHAVTVAEQPRARRRRGTARRARRPGAASSCGRGRGGEPDDPVVATDAP